MGIREDAEAYLQKIVDADVSSKHQPSKFDTYCGTPPRVMLPGTTVPDPEIAPFPSWDKRLDYSYSHKGTLTACNSFVGVYGQAMKIKFAIGGFDIEQIAANAGFTDAFIPARSGKKPKMGDIMSWAPGTLHMGVCWDKDGTVRQIAAGQGGVKTGWDIIRLVKDPVAYGRVLRGWLDLELAVDPSSKNELAPAAWMVGTWKLRWEGQDYYYWFGRGGLAQYSKYRPADKNAPPANPHDRGRYTSSGDTIRIVWNATGSKEVFTRTGDTTMQGVWNNKDYFTATKL